MTVFVAESVPSANTVAELKFLLIVRLQNHIWCISCFGTSWGANIYADLFQTTVFLFRSICSWVSCLIFYILLSAGRL